MWGVGCRVQGEGVGYLFSLFLAQERVLNLQRIQLPFQTQLACLAAAGNAACKSALQRGGAENEEAFMFGLVRICANLQICTC